MPALDHLDEADPWAGSKTREATGASRLNAVLGGCDDQRMVITDVPNADNGPQIVLGLVGRRAWLFHWPATWPMRG
jgi:hypothetical protein